MGSAAAAPGGERAEIAVTGRFQPFHLDHLELVDFALARAPRVFIAITNPDRRSRVASPESAHRHLDSANPFSWLERLQMIEAALGAAEVARGRYVIVPFPIEAPATWTDYVPAGTTQLVRIYSDWEREKVRRLEAGGYPVIALGGDPGRRLSAGALRAAMARGDGGWSPQVPPGTREYLWRLGRRVLAARCGDGAGGAGGEHGGEYGGEHRGECGGEYGGECDSEHGPEARAGRAGAQRR